MYLKYKIDKSNTHIKQFVKHLLIPVSRFLFDTCNESFRNFGLLGAPDYKPHPVDFQAI